MSSLPENWKIAKTDLGLEIITPFVLDLGGGRTVEAAFLVRDFGGPRGMLIFHEGPDLRLQHDEIIQSGYGYSVFDRPPDYESYDRDDYVELLRDWGWSGAKDQKPPWIAAEA